MIEALRGGHDTELLRPRGRLQLAAHLLAVVEQHVLEARQELVHARLRYGREPADTRALRVLVELGDAAGAHRLQLQVVAGVDLEAQPLDLEQLEAQLEVQRDGEPADAVPTELRRWRKGHPWHQVYAEYARKRGGGQ